MTTDIKTANYELVVYDEEPNNLSDNVAFVPDAADLNTAVASYKFDDGDKRSLVGAALWVPSDTDGATMMQHAYATPNGNLYGMLITRSAYTPAAGARIHIRLSILRDD